MEVIGNLDHPVSEDRRLTALDSTESGKGNRQVYSQGEQGNGTTAKGVSEVEHNWLVNLLVEVCECSFQLLLVSQQNKQGLSGRQGRERRG